jgi:hypothetical protein
MANQESPIMTQLLLDVLDNEVIVAADQFQMVGGAHNPAAPGRGAVKLVSNNHLMIALYGDWPIAQPMTQPHVWLAAWLTRNSQIRHANTASARLKTDLAALNPPAHVKGGGIIIASCTAGRPEAMELLGGSRSPIDNALDLSCWRLESSSGNPIAKGIFGSWALLAASVRLPNLPPRTDSAGRRRFLADVITACENHPIQGIAGPATVEFKMGRSSRIVQLLNSLFRRR